ncbi:MAG: hypothetical protein KF861_23250, partial [Planctomycetaceae bacterium]|nr:hypothetical protein [Planctomycetaceae bacterium]
RRLTDGCQVMGLQQFDPFLWGETFAGDRFVKDRINSSGQSPRGRHAMVLSVGGMANGRRQDSGVAGRDDEERLARVQPSPVPA